MSTKRYAYETSTTVQIKAIWCSGCGIPYGLPEGFIEQRREDHKSWTCPNGCVRVFLKGSSKAEIEAKAARERAERLRVALVAQQDQTRAAEREAAAARASETRLRWRVSNGVCPCCSRTFRELAAHVASKHPEFADRGLALSWPMRKALVALRDLIDSKDEAVVDAYGEGIHAGSLRALANRGLIERVDWSHASLTDVGWVVSEQVRGAKA